MWTADPTPSLTDFTLGNQAVQRRVHHGILRDTQKSVLPVRPLHDVAHGIEKAVVYLRVGVARPEISFGGHGRLGEMRGCDGIFR